MKLPHADQLHLQAAEGWLELGDWNEANTELDEITPTLRAHPQVLKIRYKIYSKAGRWEGAVEIARGVKNMMPEDPWGHFHLACALNELKKTQEAYDVLIQAVDKFPDNYMIRYKLACYSCKLGNLKGALDWLKKAIDLSGKWDIRLMALQEPDLEVLWGRIGEV